MPKTLLTFCPSPLGTYWDTAIMNLQVLEALGVKGRVFVLGTSQGGWICVRMALLAPEKVCLLFLVVIGKWRDH